MLGGNQNDLTQSVSDDEDFDINEQAVPANSESSKFFFLVFLDNNRFCGNVEECIQNSQNAIYVTESTNARRRNKIFFCVVSLKI